tara:strand:+ start:484 stop:735 length:252 start_codon:yes stop_codon:yes gene_type:complete
MVPESVLEEWKTVRKAAGDGTEEGEQSDLMQPSYGRKWTFNQMEQQIQNVRPQCLSAFRKRCDMCDTFGRGGGVLEVRWHDSI